MDERKICFIICANKEYFLEECLYYIRQLTVPEGYTVDAISIADAKSMTAGYNEGMGATDAKYKVYLHQDVFIIYKGFLQAILDIFASDASIGMIGMVGAPKMSVSGVMWYGHREGQLYGSCPVEEDYATYSYRLQDGLHQVDAVDGLLMVTSRDIPWREDLLDAWDFYDVSQSFEFHRAGYKVVVPEQRAPWCKHDDGRLNLRHYDKYRKICMEEYPEYFDLPRFAVGRGSSCTEPETRVVLIARNQWGLLKSRLDALQELAEREKVQLVLVDNGSEDGLRHWLREQETVDYLICEEVEESLQTILQKIQEEFGAAADTLVWIAELLEQTAPGDLLQQRIMWQGYMGKVLLVYGEEFEKPYRKLRAMLRKVFREKRLDMEELCMRAGVSSQDYTNHFGRGDITYLCSLNMAGFQIDTYLDAPAYVTLTAKQMHIVIEEALFELYAKKEIALNMFLYLPGKAEKWQRKYPHIPNLSTYPRLAVNSRGEPVNTPCNENAVRGILEDFLREVKGPGL